MKNMYYLKAFITFSIILICGTSHAINTNNKQIYTSDPNNNYALIIGACPPWKTGMTSYCKKSTKEMKEVLQKRVGIPDKNIHIVLDKQATYKGVQAGFSWLKDKTNNNPNARNFIYLNAHGGQEPKPFQVKEESLWTDFINRHKTHEMFVLWTEKKPPTVFDALDSKQWMTAQDLRKMLDPISAEKIIIIDACHAGLAGHDLLDYSKEIPERNKRESFLFSSMPLSISQASGKKGLALFTSYLVQSIYNKDTLELAFQSAREYTIFKSALNVIDGIMGDCILTDGKNFCAQWPTKEDPHNLLKQIRFSNHKLK
jgi:hypothetical protein